MTVDRDRLVTARRLLASLGVCPEDLPPCILRAQIPHRTRPRRAYDTRVIVRPPRSALRAVASPPDALAGERSARQLLPLQPGARRPGRHRGNRPDFADASYYTTGSGAAVFSAGRDHPATDNLTAIHEPANR